MKHLFHICCLKFKVSEGNKIDTGRKYLVMTEALKRDCTIVLSFPKCLTQGKNNRKKIEQWKKEKILATLILLQFAKGVPNGDVWNSREPKFLIFKVSVFKTSQVNN